MESVAMTFGTHADFHAATDPSPMTAMCLKGETHHRDAAFGNNEHSTAVSSQRTRRPSERARAAQSVHNTGTTTSKARSTSATSSTASTGSSPAKSNASASPSGLSVSSWIPTPLPPIPADASNRVHFDFSTLHPDDARDKVFVAIIKALVKLGNRPSSPKELASAIMKFHFAILGGSTPYATVSSRISQHFKRVAESRPPREPVLGRHVDERHSRKIHYYLAGIGRPSLTYGADGDVDASLSTTTDPSPSSTTSTPVSPNGTEAEMSPQKSCTHAKRKRVLSRSQSRSSSTQKRARGSVHAAPAPTSQTSTTVSGRLDQIPRWRRTALYLSGDDTDDDMGESDVPVGVDGHHDTVEGVEVRLNNNRSRSEQSNHPITRTRRSQRQRSLTCFEFDENMSAFTSPQPAVHRVISDDSTVSHHSVDFEHGNVALTTHATSTRADKQHRHHSNRHTHVTRPAKAFSILADASYDTPSSCDERDLFDMMDDDIEEGNTVSIHGRTIASRRNHLSRGGLGDYLGSYEEDSVYDVMLDSMDSDSVTDDEEEEDMMEEEVEEEDQMKHEDEEDDEVSDYAEEMMNGILDVEDTQCDNTGAHAFHSMKAINVPASPSDSVLDDVFGVLLQQRSQRRTAHSILGGQGSPSFSSLIDALSRASGEPRFSTAASLFGDALALSRGPDTGIDMIVPPVVPPPPSPISLDSAPPLTDLRDPESMSATELDRLFGGNNSGTLSTSFQDAKKRPKSAAPSADESTTAKDEHAVSLDASPNTATTTPSASSSCHSDSTPAESTACSPKLPATSADDTKEADLSKTDTSHAVLDSKQTTESNITEKLSSKGRTSTSFTHKTTVTCSDTGNASLNDVTSSTRTKSENVPSLETIQANAVGMLNTMLASRHATQQRRQPTASPQSTVSTGMNKAGMINNNVTTSTLRRPLIVPAPCRVMTSGASTLDNSVSAGLRGIKASPSASLVAPRILKTGIRLPAPLVRTRPNLSRDLMRNIPRNTSTTTQHATGSSVTKDNITVQLRSTPSKIALTRALTTSTTSSQRDAATVCDQTFVPSVSGNMYRRLIRTETNTSQSSSPASDAQSQTLPVCSSGPLSNTASATTAVSNVTVMSTSPSTSPTSSSPSTLLMIPTVKPVSPPIFLVVLESVPVFMTVLGPSQGFSRDFRMLRRVDTGYVNASALLEAGGIETESERSIILSLEVGRIRVPQRKSALFGTWIPLPRARALAATCSLQNRLGPFLSDHLASYFPATLPNTSDTGPDPSKTAIPPVASSIQKTDNDGDKDAESDDVDMNGDMKAEPESTMTSTSCQESTGAQEVAPMEVSSDTETTTTSNTTAANTHPVSALLAARTTTQGPWPQGRRPSNDPPSWLPWARSASSRLLFTDAQSSALKRLGKTPMLNGNDAIETMRATFGGLSVAFHASHDLISTHAAAKLDGVPTRKLVHPANHTQTVTTSQGGSRPGGTTNAARPADLVSTATDKSGCSTPMKRTRGRRDDTHTPLTAETTNKTNLHNRRQPVHHLDHAITAADHIQVTLDKTSELDDEELDVGGEDENDDLR